MAYRKTAIVAPANIFIPGQLHHGSQIIVTGRVLQEHERFSINLQNGCESGCDAAFHFNPRTATQSVVRNSYAGGWQNEELAIPYFPFAKGSKFTVRICVGKESYVVFVNGKQFIEFKHRLPYKNVRYLRLSEGAEYYEAIIQNPTPVPYYGEFPSGFQIGMGLKVQGIVNENASRFAINFNHDPDGEIVAVHFNPRQDQHDVVLNTKEGSWQQEERGQEWFPFPRGQYFDVRFIASDDCFHIYVNDKFFTSYKFRVPLEDIHYLHISGDITLICVQYLEPLPKDYMKSISSGLVKDELIVVKGFFYSEGSRFAVNLIKGTSCESDIALHVNARRDESTVVFNSRKSETWKEEERHPLPTQFTQKTYFVMVIVNKHKKFKVHINGTYFASFKARGSVEDIKAINVQGDAYFYDVKLLRTLETPYIERIPGCCAETISWIRFTGKPKKHAKRFDINLQCGDDPNYGHDVALHVNPRFHECCTICNSLISGGWGSEEIQQPDFPFKSEEKFEIIIVKLPNVYKVIVNRKCYIDFTHRIDVSRVSHVMLTGDCDFLHPDFY